MRFVEIKDLNHNPVAVNPKYVSFITHDYTSGTSTFVFTNDRRMQTKMFRSVNEAVKWCCENEIDTSGIGEAQ